VYVPLVQGSHPPCLWPALLNGEDVPNDINEQLDGYRQSRSALDGEDVIWRENNKPLVNALENASQSLLTPITAVAPKLPAMARFIKTTRTAVKKTLQTGKQWAYWKT
jgi:hypothetical protein